MDYLKHQTPPARILFFDIESTSLKSDFGFLLAIGYKFLGEKEPTVLSIGKFTAKNFRQKEKSLLLKFREVYLKADMTVTHNGKRFDIPFINTKMLKHGLGVLPPLIAIDTLQIARFHLKTLSRKRLDTISAYFNTTAEKSPVEGEIWVNASVGDQEALAYIVSHCKADVEVLEEIYLKLRPLFLGHPRVSGYGPCRACGSLNLQRRGLAYSSVKGIQYQVYCKDCGAWERRPQRETGWMEKAEN
ncbi:MAG: ribonuclease H-like domain-containing protein [Candidatus Dormibacteria bacterium]